MEININTHGEQTLIQPTGRFDAHEADRFRSMTSPLIVGGADLVVDLSNVAFIDSTALAELVRMMRATQTCGARLTLRDPSVPVRVVLELTGLDQVLSVIHQPAAQG